jgi:uridine kinase
VAGKHPCFKLHITPTSASWLNLVERFFAEITSRRIRRGSYSSVNDLEAAIYDYLARHNEKQKPFKWTKTTEDILIQERNALNKLHEIRGNR